MSAFDRFKHENNGRLAHSRFMRWFASQAYRLGIVAGTGTSTCDCGSWTTRLYWRGKRHYILGVSRNAWRCLLKYHHIRGDEIGLGLCAKELPCPTCGSRTAGHLVGCGDAP